MSDEAFRAKGRAIGMRFDSTGPLAPVGPVSLTTLRLGHLFTKTPHDPRMPALSEAPAATLRGRVEVGREGFEPPKA